MTKAAPRRTALRLYKSYVFVEKDPIIDVMRTVVEDSKRSYQFIHDNSGVSKTTLRSWFVGKTRRPQFATVAAVVRSLGQDISVAGKRVAPPKPSAATLRKLERQ